MFFFGCFKKMYYKVLSPTMINRSFQYKIGLNVYDKQVKDMSSKDGGLYICKKRDIGYWLKLYRNPIICEAILCDESVVFKGGRSIKTDRLVLQNPLPARAFMDLQDEDTLIDYVYDDGLALEYISLQTPDICKFAVRQNGRALEFVKNPNAALHFDAILQTGAALKYVVTQTQSQCMQAVKQNGLSLKYVKRQDKSICMMAVHNNGMALRYIKEKTPYICKIAVEQNGHALRFVDEHTDEVVKIALSKTPSAKIWVKAPTVIKQNVYKPSMAWFYDE